MLAIVIPYFKLSFFEATLLSLANQTNQNFKVYIGNDASPENPKLLLEKYKGKFDYEYHRFENNLGSVSLTQQWERCIALSENEDWFMILGDDDVLGNNVVEEFCQNLKNIEENKIDVVRFATQIIDDKEKICSSVFTHPIIEKSTDFLIRKFSKQTRSSMSEYVFKREVLIEKSFRNFPVAWHADDMAILEFSNFNQCFSINKGVVNVRVSSESVTGDSFFNDLKNKATFEFCKVIFREYSNRFTFYQKKIILKKLEMACFNIPSFVNFRTIFYYYYQELGLKETIRFQNHILRIGLIVVLKKIKMFNLILLIHSKIVKK